MYIIRGKFVGYFIASSYHCPSLLAMVVVQVLTPSIIAVVMLLVGDADLFTDPLCSPTLPLLVLVVFCMRYTFWRRVGKAIAAKFFAMRTVCWFDVPFIRLPADASHCARFSVMLWQRMARWFRRWSTALPITASLLVFLVSSLSIARLIRRAFDVRRCRHRTFFIVVGGCLFEWWLFNKLLQPFDVQVDHVCSFTGLWRRRLLKISFHVRIGQILHHVDNGFGIVYFVLKVLGLDIALCLRQIRALCMLCSVGKIGGDNKPLHVVVKWDAVGGGLCDCGGETFMIFCGALSPIKDHCHHVHHHLHDRCCGWSFSSTCDEAEQPM